MSDVEIEARLDGEIRFDKRAKSMLREATGQSAAALDNSLWSRVLDYRRDFRHRIAHADEEPSKVEAEKAVEDLIQLASLITKIVPHAAIQQRAYEKWLQDGCPGGQDVAHWLAAEKELLAPRTSAS